MQQTEKLQGKSSKPFRTQAASSRVSNASYEATEFDVSSARFWSCFGLICGIYFLKISAFKETKILPNFATKLVICLEMTYNSTLKSYCVFSVALLGTQSL